MVLNSNVKHLGDVAMNVLMSEMVDRLLTPESILNATTFETHPEIIRPSLVHCFDDMVHYREEIRKLLLVPVKNVAMHDHYNGLDKKVLLEDLMNKMQLEPMMLLENEYPYALPSDVNQDIIWYRNVSRAELRQFIGQVMLAFQLNFNDVLTFERPINDETKDVKLIRGTFRDVKHLHFWTRQK